MIIADSDDLGDAGTDRLRRAEGIALWRQIVGALRSEIENGTRVPGAQLPTEAQLSARFGVNRHTVRRALEEMSRLGLVRVEQGRGTFVTEDVLDYSVSQRVRFSEWIRRHNKEPSGRILRTTETTADQQIATQLRVRPGTRVAVLERLGLADGRPVTLTIHHFNAARFPDLLAALRRHPTITEALAAVGVKDYRRLVTRVSARLPTAEEASLLRVARARPLLVTENINVDEAGEVVEFGLARYPTPRVQIVFEP
jgi:GntR family phosphonate transport system transcriptional regulator